MSTTIALVVSRSDGSSHEFPSPDAESCRGSGLRCESRTSSRWSCSSGSAMESSQRKIHFTLSPQPRTDRSRICTITSCRFVCTPKSLTSPSAFILHHTSAFNFEIPTSRFLLYTQSSLDGQNMSSTAGDPPGTWRVKVSFDPRAQARTLKIFPGSKIGPPSGMRFVSTPGTSV